MTYFSNFDSYHKGFHDAKSFKIHVLCVRDSSASSSSAIPIAAYEATLDVIRKFYEEQGTFELWNAAVGNHMIFPYHVVRSISIQFDRYN